MADEQKTVVRNGSDGESGVIGVAGVGAANATSVVQMPIWQLIAIRVLRVYLQSVLGLLGGDSAGVIELAHGAGFWPHLEEAAFAALAIAVVSLIQNTYEFLTKLDVSNPGLRA
jgi:hypothetical protein